MRLNDRLKLCMVVMLFLCTAFVFAQEKTIAGTVTDEGGIPLPGVSIIVKGTKNGAVTDFDGEFAIKVKSELDILVFSYIGMEIEEVPASGKTKIALIMRSAAEQLDDIVIIGYGSQKKESVVGAITKAKGEDLMKSGGVSNVGEAIQGKLPGVVAISSSGLPGQTDPKIFIRGQGSWNGGGQPLILVDNIERSMGDLDLNEIESISVLKDASATAVFGVKGANGVILITTKRGKSGKAQLSLSGNATVKSVSKLPKQLNSFSSITHANESIMRELAYTPNSWNDIVPFQIQDKYRNPATLEESFQYPDVDWHDVLLKDQVTDTRVNLSVRGGSDFAKYFGSLSYQTTRDIFKGSEYNNGKGYNSEYRYDRFNYRSNLDFNITSSTKVSVNISGYYGVQEKPISDITKPLNGLYNIASSLYTPLYPDGLYGDHVSGESSFRNPLIYLTQRGAETSNRVGISSDFILDQKLNFITKGLSLNARLSYDNNTTAGRSIRDRGDSDYDNVIYRIYDVDGNEIITSPDGVNDFDYVIQPWTQSALNVSNGSKFRRLTYQGALNYKRTFADKHNTSGLFLFQREESARGSVFPSYREDWVGRITYNYDDKYFLDVNGAYNGSEKFGPGYRFELFPSAAAGWMISNENFLSNEDWLNTLKIRGSYGLVGDDRANGNRFLYDTRWENGGSSFLVPSHIQNRSPYIWYSEQVAGNPELQWETSLKSNIGIDLALFQNAVTAQFDYFAEDRENIFITGTNRNVPDFFGFAPPAANTGVVHVKGFEFVLGLKHTFANDLRLFTDFSYTRAKDKVIAREDPELKPFYQKAAGYIIGQPRAAIAGDILASWDDIYMSTPTVNDQNFRRPGYYDVIDYNGNGDYNSTDDNAPLGYSDRPQNTWTWNVGGSYKGFNLMLMFYGSQNANRTLDSRTFNKETYLFFDYLQDYWSPDNQDATLTLQPWTLDNAALDPMRNRFDASVVRLRTVEFAYDIPKSFCSQMGVSSMRFFVNGNNLLLWTDLPDDREFNGSNSQDSDRTGDYPTLRRINFGFNLNF
ncbi:TonB-linked outer membrane protein, SusC/RagA family [Lutibacter agarilyticus]|uniref:TonB-linked outer membrane protein, SusC/RagA family n=1 Tax=Lutibacter agarilyticus TaxID=1109740 RepID=A0A238Y6G6_9FLAO|nr:TonB-dependent receptor [Lutibacter agarilyticus]SNR66164.1 TonB-linked outer membrane protein, SusC/RagA family [Lutibacter agarilyticus]